MKVLRFIVILIVILLVGYLILCATAPSEMQVERTTTINAPKAAVWEQVVNLNNWDNWSPWKEQDTATVTTVTGPERQPGQQYEYQSKKMGAGKMTIAAVEGDVMKYDMHFIKPFESKAGGWLKVEGNDGAVKVTHYFKSPTSFMMRGMAKLMGGGKMMNEMFDRGLELLKIYTESGKGQVPAGAGYDIKEATFPATTFATLRKVVKFAEMDSFFAKSFAQLQASAATNIKGNAHVLAYKYDEAAGEMDIAVAFPVSAPVKGATMVSIPESKGYMVIVNGPYSGLMPAHMAMTEYAMANGMNEPMAIEEYVAMPPQVTDSTKFVTNIYYIKQ